MTDAEINLAIAKIEYPDESASELNNLDYCTNWQNIGPIIEREEIELLKPEELWVAFNRNNTHATAETPIKAAALCYLKTKEGN